MSSSLLAFGRSSSSSTTTSSTSSSAFFGGGIGTATPPLSNSNDSGLMVRFDHQPVQGVELHVHVVYRAPDGTVSALQASSKRVQYRWLRSSVRKTCYEPTCKYRGNKQATIQDLVSLNKYCSSECFRAGFLRRMKSKNSLQQIKNTSSDIKSYRGLDTYITAPSMPGLPLNEFTNEEYGNFQEYNVNQFVEEDKEEWKETGVREAFYLPSDDDVGRFLKLECTLLAGEGILQPITKSVISQVVIGAPVNVLKRKMIYSPLATNRLLSQLGSLSSLDLETSLHPVATGGHPSIRVVSYNILAEIYATPQMFPYCPTYALSWQYRRNLILRELLSFEADVICLQEVQKDHFERFLAGALRKHGYESVYKAKTRDNFLNSQGKIDGCAILFLSTKYKLVDKREVEFNAIANNYAHRGGFVSPELALSRLCRDNVGIAIILEPLQQAQILRPTDHICVANIHCFWDPEYPDVKLWQTKVFLDELEVFIDNSKYSRSRGARIPLVLSGDFNSVPGSSVVDLLTNESVSPDHPDLAMDHANIFSDPSQLTHSFRLQSAFSAVNKSEPAFTNYTQQFVGVLDYIVSLSFIILICH